MNFPLPGASYLNTRAEKCQLKNPRFCPHFNRLREVVGAARHEPGISVLDIAPPLIYFLS